MQGQSQEPRNRNLILTEKKNPKAKPVAPSQSSLAESPLWWRMPAGTYSGGAILLRSTSLRKSLCRACSAVQRLPGSSVSMWSSRSRADEGMLRKELEIRLSYGVVLNRGRSPLSERHLRPRRNPCSQNLLLRDAAAQRHQQNRHQICNIFSLVFAIYEEQLCCKSHKITTQLYSPPPRACLGSQTASAL